MRSSVLADAVVDDLEELAGEVGLVAVGEVAAVRIPDNLNSRYCIWIVMVLDKFGRRISLLWIDSFKS
jgi:hypothetical protein